MATRAHVIFGDLVRIEKDLSIGGDLLSFDMFGTYIHWDGYPYGKNGVIARLLKFSKFLSEAGSWERRFDAEYMSANWVCFEKHERWNKENNVFPVLGEGFSFMVQNVKVFLSDNHYYIKDIHKIKDVSHGDVEYVYFVLPSVSDRNELDWFVIIYAVNWNMETWRIKEAGSLSDLVMSLKVA